MTIQVIVILTFIAMSQFVAEQVRRWRRSAPIPAQADAVTRARHSDLVVVLVWLALVVLRWLLLVLTVLALYGTWVAWSNGWLAD